MSMTYVSDDYVVDKTGAEIAAAVNANTPIFLYDVLNDYWYYASSATYIDSSNALIYLYRVNSIGAADGYIEVFDVQVAVASGTVNITVNENGERYVAYHEAHGTLTAGSTTISFGTAGSNYTWHNKTLDFYTSIFGVSPTAVAFSNNNRTITLTFEAQQTDMTVKVRASSSTN